MRTYRVEIVDHCTVEKSVIIEAENAGIAVEQVVGPEEEISFRSRLCGQFHFYVGYFPNHLHAWVYRV